MTFPVTAAQLGTADMAELIIDVDRTFTPGGTDPRELGIRVFHAFIEPNKGVSAEPKAAARGLQKLYCSVSGHAAEPDGRIPAPNEVLKTVRLG